MTYANKHCRSGFSLMELLIALAILGLIVALGGPAVLNYLKRAKVSSAKMDLKAIKNQIDMFKVDTGVYPIKLTDLVKRPRDPNIAKKWLGGVIPDKKGSGYLQKLKKDPWGNAFVYKRAPYKDNPYTLYSYGAGGKRGKVRINVWDLE